MEMDCVLPRNNVGDGGAGGGFFGSRLGGGSFWRHSCCKFPEGAAGWVNERRIDVVVDEVDRKSTFLPRQVFVAKFF